MTKTRPNKTNGVATDGRPRGSQEILQDVRCQWQLPSPIQHHQVFTEPEHRLIVILLIDLNARSLTNGVVELPF
jgi:hypothetical protein